MFLSFLLKMVGGCTVFLWSGAGQQSRHQRPVEVCDGECSWCLSLFAGQSYRQGLSCPTIKTHRGRQCLQRPDKYRRSVICSQIHTLMNANHTNTKQCPLKIICTNQNITQFLQADHEITLVLCFFFIFLLPNFCVSWIFFFLK